MLPPLFGKFSGVPPVPPPWVKVSAPANVTILIVPGTARPFASWVIAVDPVTATEAAGTHHGGGRHRPQIDDGGASQRRLNAAADLHGAQMVGGVDVPEIVPGRAVPLRHISGAGVPPQHSGRLRARSGAAGEQ